MLRFLSMVVDASGVIAAVLAILAAALVVLFYVMHWRQRRMEFPAARSPANDLTNTMIMFQTMRDLLEQQKDVARQLTVSLDKKVAYIRKVVDTAAADLNEMRETARALAVELTETKAELAAVRARIAREGTALPEEDEAPLPGAPAPDEKAGAAADLPPRLEALARPTLEEPPDTGLENWVGVDFGEVVEEEAGPEEPPPEMPENGEAARSAFRALLNLEAADDEGGSGPDEEDRGNGRTNNVPLQKRVYEYNDAGMGVSEIARELGLGKGEVRLILNLRKDRGD